MARAALVGFISVTFVLLLVVPSIAASQSPGQIKNDHTAPTGSIVISGNTTYTRTTGVTLGLSGSDNLGLSAYYVSTNSTPPAPTAPGWTTVTSTTSYAASVGYTLPSGDGTKTVYAWYRDLNGNVSAPSVDTIVLDQTPPTNGSVGVAPGTNQVTVSWSGFADTTSGLATTNTYKLVFSTTGSPGSCSVGTQLLLGTATSYTHTGLTSGATYYYRVCASDKAGNMSTGAAASATVGTTAGPTGTVTINSNATYAKSTAATLTLNATDPTGVTGYYVSTSSTPPAATATGWTAVASTRSYAASVAYALSAGDGTKTVYVWYKNAAARVSPTASDSIVLDQTLPSNGTMSATPGSGQVALSWSGFADAASGLATTSTYKLVYGTGALPTSCASGTQLLLGTATTYTHTALAGGTKYYYRVCASDKAGNMSTGATASATPTTGGTGPTGSVTINGNASYAKTTAATLSLTASDPAGVTGYYISTASTPPLATAAGWTAVTSTPTYSGSVGYTLSAGDGTKTVYAWYKDAAGKVSSTASDSIVLDQTLPANGAVSAAPGTGQVTLSWSGFTDATSGLAASGAYKLVFGAGTLPTSCATGTQLLLGSATSYTHTGLTGGTTYYYRVCASDNAGNMSTGATASAAPQGAKLSGGAFLWDDAAGDVNDDRGSAIAVDPSGNVFATGHFVGTVNFGGPSLASALISAASGPSQDVYLVKYSPTGAHLWSKKLGGEGLDDGRAVSTDASGNVIVVGARQSGTIDFGGGPQYGLSGSDAFIAKYSPSGAYVWAKTLGGYGSDAANAVGTDASGNVLVAGAFDVSITGVDFGGGALYSAGSTDAFIAKYSASGAHVWSKRFGGTGLDGVSTLAVDSAGNVIVAGYFNGSAGFGGSTFTSAGGSDIFVAKYSPTGAHVWSKRFGGSASDLAYSVAVDSHGDVVLVGSFASSISFGGATLTTAGVEDIFVAKLSGVDGSHVWSKRFGSTTSDVAYGVTIDRSDNVVLTGYFSGSVDFGGGPSTASSYDIFVAKYSSTGVYQWARRFGGINPQIATAIAADRLTGNLALTGYFMTSVDFGGGILSSAGNADSFILEVGP